MKRLVCLAIALLSCDRPPLPPTRPVVAAVKAEPVLQGHLLAEDGKPLPIAHVSILGPDGKPGEVRQVGADGSFRLPWASFTQTLTRVRLSGAAHDTVMLLVAREDGGLDVSVKLGTAAPRGEATPVVLLYSAEEPAEKTMTREADGSFSAELDAPDGKYSYVLAGISNDPPIGDPVDGYEVTKEGTYRPQIVVKGGKARLHYDPRRLHESFSSVELANKASSSAGVTAISLRLAEREKKQAALFEAVLHAKGGPPPGGLDQVRAAARAETDTIRLDMAARARTAKQPLVKQAAMLAYFTGGKIDAPSAEEKALANEILATIAPDDTLWGTFPTFEKVMKVADATPKSRAYADAFVATQPAPRAVAPYLYAQLAASKDVTEQRALSTELKKPRFEGTMEQAQAKGYDPDRPLAPGKPISFDVKTLAGAKLGPKNLAGKVFLVDLWGTWCMPCVAEMPRLHEIYAKYGGAPADGRKKRFEILSIALETKPELVTEFRADKAHPMPWMHGYADPDFLERFGGPVGVPLYVLVDEKGVILTSSPALGLGKLPETLDRVLR